MKKVQNFYLYSYRLVGFVFLTGLISSILWYGFSMLFFIANSSWAVPTILSPNQERVMSHLEHVLVLEHNAAKDVAELSAFKQTLKHKRHVLKTTRQLRNRIRQTLNAQSNQYTRKSLMFKKLSNEKNKSVSRLTHLIARVHHRDRVISDELQIGLITREEALAERVASNKLRADLVDAKARMQDLHQKSVDFSRAASTLNGADKHMASMYKIVKKVELDSQITQLKSDIFSLTLNINQLHETIEKKNHALAVMRNSPYIQAINKPTAVAFVPYRNLKKARIGAPVYSCYLDMVFCYKSGSITSVYQAEEYFPHPVFKSEIKGLLVEVEFKNPGDGQKRILFLNSKPLLI
jgi:hypothetical protein